MSLKKNEFDVAIVGAGIAGLALANALDNQGIKVAVIEATAFKPRPDNESSLLGYDNRVSALTLGSIDFLQQLGVWYSVEHMRSQAFKRMYVWDGEGTGKIEFNASDVQQEALGHIVENRILVHCLLESLNMSSSVKLLENTKISKIQAITEHDGQKHAIFFNEQEITAKLLVGADGAQSYIRQYFKFKTREWNYGHNAIVCTIKTQKPHQQTAWQRFMHTGPLALLPLAGDNEQYCSIVWSAQTAFAEELMQLDERAFCEKLSAASENILGQIEQASPRISIPLRQRHAVDYTQQAVVLIADAAHTIHPLAGLGINLGLQDVAVLAEELILATQKGTPLNDRCTLARYQRRRKGDNLASMAAMEGFKRLFEQQALPLLWLRNKGMQGIGDFSPLKRQIIKRVMGL